MSFVTRLSLAVATASALIVAVTLPVADARAEELKHYDSNNKEFWLHPPDDWFWARDPDILPAKDGSILDADDHAGAITRSGIRSDRA